MYGEFLRDKGFTIGGGLRNRDTYQGPYSKYKTTEDSIVKPKWNYRTEEFDLYVYPKLDNNNYSPVGGRKVESKEDSVKYEIEN